MGSPPKASRGGSSRHSWLSAGRMGSNDFHSNFHWDSFHDCVFLRNFVPDPIICFFGVQAKNGSLSVRAESHVKHCQGVGVDGRPEKSVEKNGVNRWLGIVRYMGVVCNLDPVFTITWDCLWQGGGGWGSWCRHFCWHGIGLRWQAWKYTRLFFGQMTCRSVRHQPCWSTSNLTC